MTVQEIFGRLLKYQMEKQGVSIVDFAKYAGLTPKTIVGYIKGKTIPHSSILISASEYFHVTTDYLLGLKDEFGNKLQNPPDWQ
ncbi:MAG: helix-turn-helix domain-containing protein [Bacteroides sp.]|nr:helix-turn-helix domain-containing protein [Bacillota bacterium]MCM1394242.1 helix-turn-helix domain-containing protein [[Eubacterium] siraeum]MCM1455257.1 helix-turn-helix domain-containing protein [Bacteroides sp.]